METGLTGFDEIEIRGAPETLPLIDQGAYPVRTPDRDARTLIAASACAMAMSDDESTRHAFDPWFLARIREIDRHEAGRREMACHDTEEGMRRLKMMGFTDARLASCQDARS